MNSRNRIASLYDNPWFQVRRPNENAPVRLFCFTYAGGSSAAFRDWSEELPAYIEVVCIQLPGRGTRFKEPTISCLNRLLDALEPEIAPHLDRPYAFFGHSMGAQVAFELTRRLRRKGEPLPVNLMVSGRRAPHLASRKKPIHDLPEKEFLEEIASLNGTPEEALAHPELMELVSPILRADCKLIETWEFQDESPLPIAITAFGGREDKDVGRDQLEAWKQHTSGSFECIQFDGDHFYINQARAILLRKIENFLSIIARSYSQYRNTGQKGHQYNIA